ncbi:MAG: FAD-dependent oxidoreductase [Clostridia bacterium]
MKTDSEVQQLVDSYGNWVQNDNLENTAGGTGRMTKELYPYDSVFSPIQINRLTLKNRVVMGPMGNLDMCEENGRPNDKMLQYFFARAKGGTGLLTTGLIPVSHGIDSSVTEPGGLSYFPRIDRSRTNLMGWRDLSQGVHAYGSKIFIQLTPGLGRVGNPNCLLTMHKLPVSASWNPNFYISEIPCKRLSDHDLKKIIKNCGQAAADAKECGLDGVYLHGHEGYLLEQMTNPAFNRRQLGKYSDPQKFGIDIIKEIRRRAGANYPIMYRIDLSLALNETYGEKGMKVKQLKKFTNGRTIQDTLEYMANLVKAGVDMFDVDLGCYDNWWLPHPPAGMPAGCFLPISKIAKDYFKKNNILSNAGVEVPIVAVGKLGYPDIAEKAIRDGDCDMVMLARPLLADPDWCNKAYKGEVSDICPCIGCQEGCINEFVLGGHPQCAVNPRTGFEDIIPQEIPKATVSKRIAVLGAGPAGIIFALSSLKRGHKVDLYERNAEIGGKVIPGGKPKGKFDFENYLIYLNSKIEKAKKNANFKLILNSTADTESLKKEGYDAVVLAYGIDNKVPGFLKGINDVKHAFATDILVKPELLDGAKKVVIVGGGVVGCEAAYFLAYEQGIDVTVVEMLPRFMEGSCTANRGHLLHYMEIAGVKLHNCTKVTSFEKGKVNVEKNYNKNVPNPYNCWQPILPTNIENPLAKKIGDDFKPTSFETDMVLLAMGGRADEKMFFEMQQAHVAPELYNIGDSAKAGRVLEASRAAYNLALKV